MPAPHTGGLLLVPLPSSEATRLGDAFAAIDPWARYPYEAAKLSAYLGAEEPGAPRFAMRFDGTLAGAVGLRLNWLRGPYIQFLGVLPEFQGPGLGSVVLAWAEEQARKGEQRNLWVAASDFNTDAIRFYERHGFAPFAHLEGLVRDGCTEILLRKRL